MTSIGDHADRVNIPEANFDRFGNVFPLTLEPKRDGCITSAEDFVAKYKKTILALARTHGAVLLRGWLGSTAEQVVEKGEGVRFAGVADALDLQKYPYVGGAAPRTNVVRDVVFTTNESPPSEPIPFHHEIAQSPNPPKYIMFHCVTPGDEGGETPIIRSDEVASYFARKHPKFYEQVKQKGLRYIRVMPLEDDNTSAIGRSWKSTFLVSTKEDAEAKMKELGTEWEWLPDGSCRTTTCVIPGLRTDPRTGLETFFNSMVAAYTGWIDSRNDPTKSVVLGDGTPVDGDAIKDIERFQMARRVAFRWQSGDIIIIDKNTRIDVSSSPAKKILVFPDLKVKVFSNN